MPSAIDTLTSSYNREIASGRQPTVLIVTSGLYDAFEEELHPNERWDVGPQHRRLSFRNMPLEIGLREERWVHVWMYGNPPSIVPLHPAPEPHQDLEIQDVTFD